MISNEKAMTTCRVPAVRLSLMSPACAPIRFGGWNGECVQQKGGGEGFRSQPKAIQTVKPTAFTPALSPLRMAQDRRYVPGCEDARGKMRFYWLEVHMCEASRIFHTRIHMPPPGQTRLRLPRQEARPHSSVDGVRWILSSMRWVGFNDPVTSGRRQKVAMR
ncbi:hypothetical protein IE53DRAFT_95592 [Violaceomyces palustris]|uniref:Uncharacterized protein n=1 Tax=Violaceomyces palustris TaxID=1673888 RepID=A0ACD0P710_9BASI|nr:hypothetical protein IE53DRAFT_95592 [Violaceomyces palustris]